MGDDMENKPFGAKADALRWLRGYPYQKIRDMLKEGRPVIHEKSNFQSPTLCGPLSRWSR
jgi:hypothetical protein